MVRCAVVCRKDVTCFLNLQDVTVKRCLCVWRDFGHLDGGRVVADYEDR